MPSHSDLLVELAALAADAADTLAPPELAGVCDAVVATARRAFGAAACSIAVIDDEAGELVYVAASGSGAAEIIGTRLSIGRGFGGWVAQSGQPVAVSDLGSDPRFARDVAEATNYIPNALMAIPIEGRDGVVGVLTVLDRDVTRPGEEHDLELAADFAAQAAAGIMAADAFRSIGAILLRELGRAASADSTLRDALDAPAQGRSTDPLVRRYCAMLADLRAVGPAEQHLAVQVIENVLAYVRRRGGPSRPPP